MILCENKLFFRFFILSILQLNLYKKNSGTDYLKYRKTNPGLKYKEYYYGQFEIKYEKYFCNHLNFF